MSLKITIEDDGVKEKCTGKSFLKNKIKFFVKSQGYKIIKETGSISGEKDTLILERGDI